MDKKEEEPKGENKSYQYYVVEVMEPLLDEAEKYVCVPDTWLLLRESDTEQAIVKYPLEPATVTRRRVRDREPFDNSWPVLEVAIKYGTDSYKDAKKYISILYNILIQELEAEGIAKTDKPVISVNEDSTSETLTPGDTTATQPPATKKPVKQQEVDDVEKQVKRYHTRQYYRNLIHKKSPSAVVYTTTQDTSEEDPIEELASTNIENKPQEQVGEELTCETYDSNRKDLLKTVLLNNLNKMESILESKLENIKRIHQIYFNHLEKIRTMKSLFENFDEAFPVFIADIKKKLSTMMINQNDDGSYIVDNFVTVIEKLGETKRENDETKSQFGNKNDQDEKYVDAKSKAKCRNIQHKSRYDQNRSKGKLTQKKRGIPRKFVLPPEYDANDSRWTLRYGEKTKDLVELMPHSNIYVNEIKLKHFLRVSKDSKTLARLLLVEIFNDNALSTCSLTGKKANAFDMQPRPGLDDHARTVLLNFVEEHALRNKWVKLDIISILNTLRNKIQDMRMKYG